MAASSGFAMGSHFEYGLAAEATRRRKKRKLNIFWRTVRIAFAVTLIGSVGTTLFVSSRMPELDGLAHSLRSMVGRHRFVSRIAFGSGSSMQYSPQPVWTQAVIPSSPDAWIWVGDMAYLDVPSVNCAENKRHPECRCQVDWLHEKSCMAGNVSHAQARAQLQISNPDYSKFLEFMCPGHREKQMYPPRGPDPSSCPRMILGTYDDHDYGWQRGNRRLPEKDILKGVYLDAIGEPETSPRRKPHRGIEHVYTLNTGHKGKEIDVILLDERYYRDPLPCYTRKTFCEKAALHNVSHEDRIWCQDFVRGNGTKGAVGSCCDKDQKLFLGWCKDKRNQKHELWKEACDPTSASFGGKALTVNKNREIEEMESQTESELPESPFCEVLGRQQREWLEAHLLKSKAPLKLIVSPSPLFTNPLPMPCWGRIANVTEGGTCPCMGDDWECYKPAQLHLLHTLGRAQGCVVVLTGDLGYSDIKMVGRGEQVYSEHYRSKDLGKQVFQVMASQLVAKDGRNYKCGGDWRTADPVNTRLNLECDFVPPPAFGMVEVVWDQEDPTVRLQIIDGKNGQLKLESLFSLSQCRT